MSDPKFWVLVLGGAVLMGFGAWLYLSSGEGRRS